MFTLIQGDCLEKLSKLTNNSIDSIVTDPPYGLHFMAKKWDYNVPSVAVWKQCLRVLKPGGHLLSFAGSRTHHRMTVNIEEAGFEIRDMIAWLYGQGFPKSLNVAKAINKAAGVAFKSNPASGVGFMNNSCDGYNITLNQLEMVGENTTQAQQWDGWGTALKPAIEPITLARKALSEKTVAANVLKWGTGSINIDECRVATDDMLNGGSTKAQTIGRKGHEGWDRPWKHSDTARERHAQHARDNVAKAEQKGRWPANVMHDGSDEVLQLFPETSPSKAVARFFYCAKASKNEKNIGCKQIEPQHVSHDGRDAYIENPYQRHDNLQHNHHPTVKPIKLMQYLVTLVTPPSGSVLDPFMGSGTTGIACKNLNRNFIGIELDNTYFEIAQQRISAT